MSASIDGFVPCEAICRPVFVSVDRMWGVVRKQCIKDLSNGLNGDATW